MNVQRGKEKGERALGLQVEKKKKSRFSGDALTRLFIGLYYTIIARNAQRLKLAGWLAGWPPQM